MAKDKLNPLKTKHDIEVELDDVSYKLVFKPINKHTQEKLDKTKNESKEQYETVDSKKVELKEYKDLKSVNDDLLKTFGAVGGITLEQKTSILIENKEYVIKISSLEKQIRNIEKDLTDVNVAVENYYKQFFEESIEGTDKVKFQKAIDDAGISYAVINVYIIEALKESQEKK
ncbi:MAG: hypothetical protein DI602_10110 [Aliarcobacter butzleri]|nr:MAG: hypothetical protein DI602_10110 [Aliarcobacter butzleri]